MTFYSLHFLILFAFTLLSLAVCKLIFKKNTLLLKKINQCILLTVSYIFVCIVDWKFCLSVLAVTLTSYFCALLIDKNRSRAKLFVAIGVIIPTLMLGFFKYFNFFVSSFNKIFGVDSEFSLNFAVPLGISFFTFTAISYVVDVYRKKIEVTKDFIKIALYISFFPKFISGPIIRASEFMPQLDENRTVSWENIEKGLQIFLFGFIKKVVLADHLGVFVGDVYATPQAYDSFTVILCVISYSLQIYLDFSGYTDMAIGIAKCVGFDFSKNFNLPYISKNVTEFWKRWHISLSEWLMDYIYIPLGGNRKGKVRQYINLLLTMLIGGFWHGANITFIIWGGLHGLALIVHKLFMSVRKNKDGKIATVISVFGTYAFVSLLWVFFRAENFTNAFDILKKIFIWSDGIHQMYSWSIVSIVAVIASTVVALIYNKNHKSYDKKGKETVSGFYPMLELSKIWNIAILLIIAGLAIILAYTGASPFIYGKF